MINLLVEKYNKESNWLQKCIILQTIHLGMLSEHPTWRVRDTALLLHIGIGTASEDLSIAENMDKISKCESRNKALKEIRLK